MSKNFRIELAYSLDKIGVRVIASPSGWGGASAKIQVTGSLTTDEALAFAEELQAKAEAVAARNLKQEKAKERRMLIRLTHTNAEAY